MDLADLHRDRGFECVCGNLRMTARKVSSIYDRHLEPTGLLASQLAVLWAVASLAPAVVKKIAQTIAMDETALLRNLRILERRELVALRVGEDRRQRVVELTAAGRRAFNQALPLWKEAQEQVRLALGNMTAVADLNHRLLALTQALD